MEPPRPYAGGAQRGRKRKSTESTQKERRRGMGVEQLERIRIMSESTQPHHHPLTQCYLACPGFAGYGPVGQMGFNQMGLGLTGGLGFGPPPSLGPRVGVIGEASREHASVQSFIQFQDHLGLSNKDAEVMAVHRKGNSRVLEYGFFPQSCKNKTDPKDDDPPPSLSLTTMTPISPSKSIDLSLKL